MKNVTKQLLIATALASLSTPAFADPNINNIQVMNGSIANVRQTDTDNSATGLLSGAGNIANVNQNGTGNKATANILPAGAATNNTISLSQTGTGNTAQASIASGSRNVISISQNGEGSEATARLSAGSGSRVNITQSSGNKASINGSATNSLFTVRQTGVNGSVTSNLQGNGVTVQAMQLMGSENSMDFESEGFDRIQNAALRAAMVRNWHAYTTGKILAVQNGDKNKFKLLNPFAGDDYAQQVNKDIPDSYMALYNDVNSQVGGNENDVQVTNGSTSYTQVLGNKNKVKDRLVNTKTTLYVSGNGNDVSRNRVFTAGTAGVYGNNNKVVQNLGGSFTVQGDNNNVTQTLGLLTLTGSGNTVSQSSEYVNSGPAVLNVSNSTNGNYKQLVGPMNTINSTVDAALNSGLNINSIGSNVTTTQQTVTNSTITKAVVDWQRQMGPAPVFTERTVQPTNIAGTDNFSQKNTQNSNIAYYVNGTNSADLRQLDTNGAQTSIIADASNARFKVKQSSNNSSVNIQTVSRFGTDISVHQGFTQNTADSTGNSDIKVASSGNIVNAYVYGNNKLGINQVGTGNRISTSMTGSREDDNKQYISQSGTNNLVNTMIEGYGHYVNIAQNGVSNSATVYVTSMAKLGIIPPRAANDPLPPSVFATPHDNTINIVQGGDHANMRVSVTGSNNVLDLTQGCRNCTMNVSALTDFGNLKATHGRNNDSWSIATTSNQRIEATRY